MEIHIVNGRNKAASLILIRIVIIRVIRLVIVLLKRVKVKVLLIEGHPVEILHLVKNIKMFNAIFAIREVMFALNVLGIKNS